jgi:anthraniloyl-CoA monooxygenase
MSRAGAVSLEQLREAAPGLAGQAVADYAGLPAAQVPSEGFAEWVLARPLPVNGYRLAGRLLDPGREPDATLWIEISDPWGPEAQQAVDQIAALVAQREQIIGLTGPSNRGALLDRLALGERVRSELGAVIAVRCQPDQLSDVVDGLVAGRADLVTIGND